MWMVKDLRKQMESELKTSKHLQSRYEKRLLQIKAEDEEKPELKHLNHFSRGHNSALIDAELDKQRLLEQWISKLERSEQNGSTFSVTI